eukprot:972796-Pyramimonas_sp.AAC.1
MTPPTAFMWRVAILRGTSSPSSSASAPASATFATECMPVPIEMSPSFKTPASVADSACSASPHSAVAFAMSAHVHVPAHL